MLHPTSLAVAVAVAETDSASRAAQRLRISQPAVSYHLRKLERTIGVPVFRRGAAGMAPTPAGERLLSGARNVLTELERLELEARRIGVGEADTLRISSACFTNYHWLPQILEDLGEFRIELDVDPGRRPFERLDRGELDIALTTDPPERAAFRKIELFDDEIVAVLAPDHPLAGHERLCPEDFADQTVVVFDRSQSDLFTRVLEPAGIQPRHVMDVPVTEALLELVRVGSGISAMATWVVHPELCSGRLVGIRIGESGLRRRWFAVVSARRTISELARRFLERLRRGGPAGAAAPGQDEPVTGLARDPTAGPARGTARR